MRSRIIFWPLIWLCLACHASGTWAQTPAFGERRDLGEIEYSAITEASGLAASRQNKEVLWTHNDSGDRNRVFALNTAGKHLGVFTIAGVAARDWEDLALGPGPAHGTEYLYIGDIGDNDAKHEIKHIYRVPEPRVLAQQAPVEQMLEGAKTIAFRYPDGKRDAETLMVDPRTKDLYVVSKREANVHLYRAPYPQSTTQETVLELVAALSLGGVVAGDISRAGDEILLKTYDAIYYWRRGRGQTVAQALLQIPVKVPYIIEPQGEGVCWHPQGKGYYTVSEEFQNIPAHLYFYPRLLSTKIREKNKASFE